jgi:colanic acid/amylovoran biosynthesis glycosyltransferase
MPTVAYLSNQFPSPLEPYMVDEIQDLRRRGVAVVACSALRTSGLWDGNIKALAAETLYLQPLRVMLAFRAVLVFLLKLPLLSDLLHRIFLEGSEPLARRLQALLHTWLGVYYALLIEKSGVEHIHAHHGYFASWIAMVAARLLGIEFSMTLHGSDLLLHAAYLDTKLEHCKFCVTVSEFNRRYILGVYPGVASDKVVVQRMGVDPGKHPLLVPQFQCEPPRLMMLAVGRLHPVKDHAFLVHACRALKDRNVSFACRIAGEGPERASLEQLIHSFRLDREVQLLGHLSRVELDACYAPADLVVLTSRSEGIPLVLMEAMARGKPVLAPAITGIPELVADGETGFLYRPGSEEDFVAKVELVRNSLSGLGPLRRAARHHVLESFNREKNLAAFCTFFIAQVNPTVENHSHENPVLQQIQLPVQRH